MDHMPTVSEPIFPPIKVPCLSQDPYDNEIGRFEEYPCKKGWSLVELKRGEFSHRSAGSTAVFLQDWLFFGVLYEVLGQRGQKEAFIRWDPDSGQTLVDTENLHGLLRAHFLDYVEPPEVLWTQMLSDFERWDKVLRMVSLFCNAASSQMPGATAPTQSSWPLSPEIDFSIRALGAHLASSFYAGTCDIAMRQVTTLGCPLVSNTLSFPPGEYAASRMREAGWCRSDIAMVSEHMSPSSLYYASSLRRFQTRRDHSKCTKELCIANQIDPSTYKTAHKADDCLCEHVQISVQKLISIIAKDGIPVVTIATPKASSQPKLEISQFRYGQSYIAISHVWSDGMGNADQNSLPACQLGKLKDFLEEVIWSKGKAWDNLNKAHFNKFLRRMQGKSIAFWMDTLCIPVEKQWKAYRNKSITMMYEIYRNAESVLILDAELQMAPMPSHIDEVFLRVRLSGWMRRLWTLQESVLGRRLHVKFRDGIVDLTTEHDRHSRWQNHEALTFHTQAGSPSSDSRSFYWNDRALRFLITDKRERKFIGIIVKETSYEEPAQAKLGKECEALLRAFVGSNFRSSTRKSDEFRCLASLLGFDTTCLIGRPIEQRMKALLEQRDILPQGLLFIAGQRIPEKGWGWALQHFGNNGSRQLNVFGARADATPAKRSAEGLIVTYPGFILAASNRPRSLDNFYVEVPKFHDDEIWVLQVCRHDDGSQRMSRSASTIEGDAQLADISSSQSPLAIFFYNPNPQRISNIFIGAILADVERSGDDVMEDSEIVVPCTYRGLAKIQIHGRKEALVPASSDPRDPTATDTLPSSSCKIRRWCVG